MAGEAAQQGTLDLRQSIGLIRDLHRRQQYEPARDLCQRALQSNPNQPDLIHLLAVSEMMSGRPDLGLPLLERVAAMEPNNANHLRAMVPALKALNRLSDAINVSEKAMALMAAQPIGLEPAAIGRRTSSHHLQARPANIAHFRKSKALAALTELFLSSSAYHVDDLARLYLLFDNVTRTLSRGVTGDIAEFGVWRGHTAKALKDMVPGRMLYLFDSFTGVPAGSFAAGDRRGELFRDTSLQTAQAMVGADQVVWRPGKFPDTAQGLPADLRFAIVHVDFGSASGTQAALDFAYPRLNSGGLLLIHDYANDSWPDVAVTTDKFLADKPERLVVAPDKGGTGVLIKG